MRKFLKISQRKTVQYMGILNERIKERRLQLGYTLLYVADLLGVKEATVQRYESGEIKNIKHETIISLSNILKCDPAYLMGWQENPFQSHALSSYEKKLIAIFRTLNSDGQHKLVERAEELYNLGYIKENNAKMA